MQQLLSMGALPSTLSSRAKPRDLRFSGPFVEMFFDRAKRKGGTCGSFNQRPMPPQAPPYPLSSRPEFSWAVGPPKEMKNGSHAATALHGRATLHLVIPSEAEGPAVQRTFRGNVFRQSVAQRRDLRFALMEKRNLEAIRPRHIRFCRKWNRRSLRCATL